MRTKGLLTVLIILCSYNVFGQQAKKESAPKKDEQKEIIQNLQSKIDNQQVIILQLQEYNTDIQKRLGNLEKEMDYYRGDIKSKVAEIDAVHSHWLTLMSIIIGSIVAILGVGLGIVAPFVLNTRNNKHLKKSYEKMLRGLKTKIASVEQDATSAKNSLSEITSMKSDIETIKKEIDKSKKDAERAAKRATASKLFAQALSENDALKAIELYTKIIDIYPDHKEAYNNRGVLKCDFNKDEAIKDYDKAIEIDSNYARAYYNRGVLKYDIKDKEGALKDYDRAIKIDSTYAKAYFNRGIIKDEANDNAGAMNDYSKAIDIDPNYSRSYFNRGLLKSKMNDKEGALKDYEKAIETDPSYSSSYNNKAFVLMEMGEYNKALDAVNEAISLTENNYEFWDTKGEILMNMEEYEEAIKTYIKAIALNEKFKPSLLNRAKCYRRLAELEQDTAKKADLLAKAEADEEKAKSLGDEE